MSSEAREGSGRAVPAGDGLSLGAGSRAGMGQVRHGVGARRRTFELLEAALPGDRWSYRVDVFILALIALNVLALIIATVPAIEAQIGGWLRGIEYISIALFSVEYLLRVWSSREAPGITNPVTGRIRFASRPLMLIDLLAILPAYIPFVGVDLRFARALRLMRVFRILRVARYSAALQALGRVFLHRRHELILTGSALGLVLVISSSALYFTERGMQPDAFGSIPETMWWAVATLTTVGYGDVYPMTSFGRLLGGMVALLGVCVVAIPTAIIGAGFMDELRYSRSDDRACPTCGRVWEDGAAGLDDPVDPRAPMVSDDSAGGERPPGVEWSDGPG